MSETKQSLSPFYKYASPFIKRIDRIVMLVLTLVYGIIALLNLGTLIFPESVCTIEDGESFSLSAGSAYTLSKLSVNGNIADGGKLHFYDAASSDSEPLFSYEQDQGDMFKWEEQALELQISGLLLVKAEGELRINELALWDERGNLIPLTVSQGFEALVDEQDTVPESPSYLNGMYFDEIYHARTAYEHIHNMSVYEWTHPPLGKLIIALGILLFGMNPFGWRVMGALFGIAMVPIVYVLAKRFTKRTDCALVAAALWAFDGMHFAQTRIATIDVYGVFFILLMFLFMYEYLRQDYMTAPIKKLFLPLGLSGLSFGLGVASKWIGCYAGAGLALLFFSHMLREGLALRKDKILRKVFWRRSLFTCLYCLGVFVALPALIYFLSYMPYYLYEASLQEGYGLTDAIKTLLHYQEMMYGYHADLSSTHLCQSAWYQWPFTAKGVWFYISTGDTWISNISSIGSPAVWWISSVGAVCLFAEWVMGKLAKDKALWILFVGVVANFLPWILVTRCVFLYHFFATVPFLLLSTVYLLNRLEISSGKMRYVKWVWLFIGLLYFVLMYPAISGLPCPKWYAYFIEHILPTGQIYYGWI